MTIFEYREGLLAGPIGLVVVYVVLLLRLLVIDRRRRRP